MLSFLRFWLEADTSPLRRALDRLGPQFQEGGKKLAQRLNLGIAGGIAALGFMLAQGLGRAIRESVTDAMESLKQSSRLDLTVEDFQKIKLLADETGESVDNLVKLLKKGGPAVAEIRREMERLANDKGGVVQTPEAETIAYGGKMLDKAWGWVKGVAGYGVGRTARFASAAVGAMKGMFKYQGAGPYGRRADDYLGIFGEALKGWNAPGESAKSQRSTTKLVRDAVAQMEADEKPKSGNKNGIAALKAALSAIKLEKYDTDELSRVGIAHARTGYDQKSYQEQSLDYLKKIEANTGELKEMGNVES